MNLNIAHTGPALARANGIELTYDTFGDAQAPPLVLIMGLAAQMIAWDDEFCAALAARGFRVIRFDNRDIGLSTRLGSLGVPNVPQLLQAHRRASRSARPTPSATWRATWWACSTRSASTQRMWSVHRWAAPSLRHWPSNTRSACAA